MTSRVLTNWELGVKALKESLMGAISFPLTGVRSVVYSAQNLGATQLFLTPAIDDRHIPILTIAISEGTKNTSSYKQVWTQISALQCKTWHAETGKFVDDEGNYSVQAGFWSQYGVKWEGVPYTGRNGRETRAQYRFLELEFEYRSSDSPLAIWHGSQIAEMSREAQEMVAFMRKKDANARMLKVVVSTLASTHMPDLDAFMDLCNQYEEVLKKNAREGEQREAPAAELQTGGADEDVGTPATGGVAPVTNKIAPEQSGNDKKRRASGSPEASTQRHAQKRTTPPITMKEAIAAQDDKISAEMNTIFTLRQHADAARVGSGYDHERLHKVLGDLQKHVSKLGGLVGGRDVLQEMANVGE